MDLKEADSLPTASTPICTDKKLEIPELHKVRNNLKIYI